MGEHLLNAFARDDPDRFAQLLGATKSVEETVTILTAIPDGLECDVIARLTPRAADLLLNGLDDDVLVAWLTSGSIEGGRGLLSRINTTRANQLIAALSSRAKRRRLSSLVGFPAGSIGKMMHVKVVGIKRSTPASKVEAKIRQQGEEMDGPIAILDDAGKVIGVLDLVKFIQNSDPDAIAQDFCVAVSPAYVEASPESQLKRDDWAGLNALPVTDYEGKLLGYVTRFDLERATETASEGSIFVQSVIELSKQFLEFMIYVITRILDTRPVR